MSEANQACRELRDLERDFEKFAKMEGNEPIRCSRMHFEEWAAAIGVNRVVLGKSVDSLTDQVNQLEAWQREVEAMRHPAVKRAIEIVNAVEWEGDMRVNMTTVVGASRVLAKRVAELEKWQSEATDAIKSAAVRFLDAAKTYTLLAQAKDGVKQ